MKFKKLTIENVEHSVSKNATGTYFLAKNVNSDIHLKYIGRSDTRLRERLLNHVKIGKYTHFSFQLTNTIYEAYRIECREWHNAIDLDNKIHPKKPKNLNYRCPYCRKNKGGYKEWTISSKK